MRSHLRREDLVKILDLPSVDAAEFEEIVDLFRDEISEGHLPEPIFRIDPRSGDRIVYSAARSSRPHDNRPPIEAKHVDPDCVICGGDTTGVIDVEELSEGFTFINKNLFPAFFPFETEGTTVSTSAVDKQAFASGLHILQWTSSFHDVDWHNMGNADRFVVMERLAILERKLLSPQRVQSAKDGLPDVETHVLIFKNYGPSVGASLSHGHQQIVRTNVTPRTALDNLRFYEDSGVTFSEYMLRETPSGQVVKDYGPTLMVVPLFMRRPYEMMLFVKDADKSYLHELSADELRGVADGWHDATRFFHEMMPRLGKEVAYNIITHTGPGAGLYVEFLPYTQPMGGLEQLGLFVCQELPERAAERARAFYKRGK